MNIKVEPFKKEWINLTKTNCYAYALGIDTSCDELVTKGFEPGFTQGIKLPMCFDADELINNVVIDLDNLKIDFRHVNDLYRLAHGEWRIAIFGGYRFSEDKYDDYHFMKQTSDGIWLHKNGYYGKPTSISSLKKCYVEDDVLYSHIATLCLKK